jgi:hypothetical protein
MRDVGGLCDESNSKRIFQVNVRTTSENKRNYKRLADRLDCSVAQAIDIAVWEALSKRHIDSTPAAEPVYVENVSPSMENIKNGIHSMQSISFTVRPDLTRHIARSAERAGKTIGLWVENVIYDAMSDDVKMLIEERKKEEARTKLVNFKTTPSNYKLLQEIADKHDATIATILELSIHRLNHFVSHEDEEESLDGAIQSK